jgi:hypothetical protein
MHCENFSALSALSPVAADALALAVGLPPLAEATPVSLLLPSRAQPADAIVSSRPSARTILVRIVVSLAAAGMAALGQQ